MIELKFNNKRHIDIKEKEISKAKLPFFCSSSSME